MTLLEMPSYKDSKLLCDKTNIYWQQYFRQHFDSLLLDIESKEEDLEYQRTKKGDFIITLDYPNKEDSIKTIETKIREEWVYNLFKKDKLLAVEFMGNVELNRLGSSFFECKADLWAYGFHIEGQHFIASPKVFWVKPLQEFLSTTKRNYRIKVTNTEGIYRTYFYLVPLGVIPEDCICHSLQRFHPFKYFLGGSDE